MNRKGTIPVNVALNLAQLRAAAAKARLDEPRPVTRCLVVFDLSESADRVVDADERRAVLA